MPISVLLVEDNQVFREGLELVLGLRSEIEIVGAAEDGQEAAEIARELRPDVVLMDYRLPGLDGVASTSAVLQASPDSAIVGLTATANQREREAWFEAGAVACLSKDDDLDEIVAAVIEAARSR